MNNRKSLVSRQLSRRNVLRALAGASATPIAIAIANTGRTLAADMPSSRNSSRKKPDVRVQQIDLSIVKVSNQSYLDAEVTVDAGRRRLRYAEVTVHVESPNGKVVELQEETDRWGVASFLPTLQAAGVYTLTVVNIDHSDYTYAPEKNVETEEWINFEGAEPIEPTPTPTPTPDPTPTPQPDPTPTPTPDPTPTPEPDPTPTPSPGPDPTPADEYDANVKDYGATGNGSTDDTSAVQQAINAVPSGGQIYFPEGVYRIRTALRINSSVALIGESRNNTILETEATWGGLELRSGANGVAIRDLTFQDGGNGYGIRMYNARNVDISNCLFRDYHYNAISLQPVQDVSITDCEFRNIRWTGVRLEEIGSGEANRRITIDNCNFYNQTTWNASGNPHGHGAVAAHGWNQHHNLVIKNCFVDAHGIALALDTVFDSRVENCRLIGRGGFGEGVAFSGSRNTIINNTINNFPAAGILHWGTDYQGGQDNNVIQNNTCYDNAQGIAFIQGSWNTPMRWTKIDSNTCYSSGSGLVTQHYGIQTYQGWEGTPNPEYEGIEITYNDLSENASGSMIFMHTNGIYFEGNIE